MEEDGRELGNGRTKHDYEPAINKENGDIKITQRGGVSGTLKVQFTREREHERKIVFVTYV